jgi:hypothetical protein
LLVKVKAMTGEQVDDGSRRAFCFLSKDRDHSNHAYKSEWLQPQVLTHSHTQSWSNPEDLAMTRCGTHKYFMPTREELPDCRRIQIGQAPISGPWCITIWADISFCPVNPKFPNTTPRDWLWMNVLLSPSTRGHRSGRGTTQYFLKPSTYDTDMIMQASSPLMDQHRYVVSGPRIILENWGNRHLLARCMCCKSRSSIVDDYHRIHSSKSGFLGQLDVR